MALAAIAFYLLAAATLISAFLVVIGRNPVHSVLFLIVTFFSAAGLFVLLGAEFLAMLLIVVYVGAVAVLFLFVVMMLDVDFAALRAGFASNLPIGLGVGALLAGEMVFISVVVVNNGASKATAMAAPGGVTNAEAIGRLLYTDYAYYFQAAGLVLLVAMIGAIVLTLRHRAGVKRQNIADQVARTPASGMRIVQIESGEGLK
jgi:NADH-quinone oxidoreductase subunit J